MLINIVYHFREANVCVMFLVAKQLNGIINGNTDFTFHLLYHDYGGSTFVELLAFIFFARPLIDLQFGKNDFQKAKVKSLHTKLKYFV